VVFWSSYVGKIFYFQTIGIDPGFITRYDTTLEFRIVHGAAIDTHSYDAAFGHQTVVTNFAGTLHAQNHW
jgi:hypothetical protein